MASFATPFARLYPAVAAGFPLALNVATLAWIAADWRREGARPLAQGKA